MIQKFEVRLRGGKRRLGAPDILNAGTDLHQFVRFLRVHEVLRRDPLRALRGVVILGADRVAARRVPQVIGALEILLRLRELRFVREHLAPGLSDFLRAVPALQFEKRLLLNPDLGRGLFRLQFQRPGIQLREHLPGFHHLPLIHIHFTDAAARVKGK